MKTASRLADDPLWYKDAILYEVHVRAFSDSDGDGVGDFRGLTDRLDYLQDLGVNTIWLLPFYPSPLKDDGYDIADYASVHPMYGTMGDFKVFLREAHRRGLRVVTELVLNHTSDRHPWFQRARRSPPGSRLRDFYVWNEGVERYKEARIIFEDFESSNWAWDSTAKAHFWHRFYSHQPDLNFDNLAVHRALLQVVDFWFDLGVDGLRLDAVPYLYEREGTSCENLPETHGFLKKLRRHVEGKYRNRMLLAEANQWPEEAVAYFGEGDECHMAFHFPIMPRMFLAVHQEDRFPLVDILAQTPAVPGECQWALFLRNHDELTLEMVTDEERDYMYRVYAHDRQARLNLGIRRRLAPLLNHSRRRIELLNGLLFSLPGTPVIYYGDEIGMGDNIYLGDRNGVRTPMQWSADRNAGFSRANPQRLFLPVIIDPEYHYEALNVEAQRGNPNSLFWWMKRLIALSRRFKAFGRGSMEVLAPENHKVFAFLRRYQEETILVVANLSRFVQFVELDLAAFRGSVPVELFGRTEFPRIGELPYLLTLGPHAFYWFSLEPARKEEVVVPSPAMLRTVEVEGEWKEVFADRARASLEEALAPYLAGRRWFAGKARRLKGVRIADLVPASPDGTEAALAVVQAEFADGPPQIYSVPLAYETGSRAEQRESWTPQAIVCRLRTGGRGAGEEGVLYDALFDAGFCGGLLEAIGRRRQFRGSRGRLVASPTATLRPRGGQSEGTLPCSLVKGEQSNTSVIFGDRWILKWLRRVEPGKNPDLEIGRFLTERTGFRNCPPVGGFLEYRRDRAEPLVLGILNGFVPNQGDAWKHALDELGRYFERVRSLATPLEAGGAPEGSLLALAGREPPSTFAEMVGAYLETARRLGERTAEMHLALASDAEDPDFAPEPFTPFYQRSVFQSMRSQATQVLPLLRKRGKDLPEPARQDADKVLALEPKVVRALRALAERKIDAMRIRCHGDFHLGQVLHTGKDLVILDFEGEPSRPLGERRLKRTPMRDVAGMLRSFHYAAYAALFEQESRGEVSAERFPALEAAARAWHLWTGAAFLRAYLERAGKAVFVPSSSETTEVLLRAFLLDKAVYELGYELNHRPQWVRIPLKGIVHLLESAGDR